MGFETSHIAQDIMRPAEDVTPYGVEPESEGEDCDYKEATPDGVGE
jgi:hypothetical protein